MKILVPLPYDLSTLAHGRNLRIVHLLNELSRHCEICCIAPWEPIAHMAQKHLPDVQIIAARADNGFSETCIEPYTLRRSLQFLGYDPRLLAEVAYCASDADVLLGFDIPSAVYLLGASLTQNTKPRTVCDCVDDPWLTWKSWPLTRRLSPLGIKTAIATRTIRRHLLSRFDALTAVAPNDASSLSTATGIPVQVVPNGVEIKMHVAIDNEREPLVVFTGAMNFPPNEAAAKVLIQRVWPRVQRMNSFAKPQAARLAIVGANPSTALRHFCHAHNVIVTGRVDDISTWLHRAQIAVAPMVSGCGMKNKVLEACAAACPVIATTLGSAGLPTGPQNGIIVADGVEQFSNELTRLLSDPDTARTIGIAGQSMVAENYSWSEAADKMLAVVAQWEHERQGSRNELQRPSSHVPGPFIEEEVPTYASS